MSFELLGIGKTLANDLGSGLCAFVIGQNVENIAKEAFQCGASKVYAVDGALFKAFNAEAYSKAAHFLLDKHKPELALFRATSQGTDVAAASAHGSVSGSAPTASASGWTADNKAHTGCLRRQLHRDGGQ